MRWNRKWPCNVQNSTVPPFELKKLVDAGLINQLPAMSLCEWQKRTKNSWLDSHHF
jgi:hypothetical protein